MKIQIAGVVKYGFHHIGMSVDNAEVTLYVDGKMKVIDTG